MQELDAVRHYSATGTDRVKKLFKKKLIDNYIFSDHSYKQKKQHDKNIIESI